MRKARILRSGDGSIEALFYFILIGCNAMNYFIFWLTIVVRGRVRNMAADYGSTNIDRGSAINVGAITAAKSIASRPDRLSTVLIRVALTEFLVVACTAYLVSLIYNRTVLLRWPPPQEYIPRCTIHCDIHHVGVTSVRAFSCGCIRRLGTVFCGAASARLGLHSLCLCR